MTAPNNWGRWGADDERGTLNILLPEHVRHAASLVKTGRVFSLGLDLSPEAPKTPTRNALWHRASKTERPGPAMSSADDLILMHTHTATHLDALCHVWVDGALYNGYPSSEIDHTGAPRNGVHNVQSIAGRGVLLDVARLRGVDYLEPGQAISAAELDAVARAQAVEIRPGDIVLVRTGWIQMLTRDRARFDRMDEPGPGRDTVEWFRQHELIALGADNCAVEVLPPEDGIQMAVHVGVIRDLGGYLIEYLDLEELAAARVYEFLFVLAPLRLVRGIGSPVNPIAIA
ncbi:MAG: cyclase family protein [Chloroflexota bacterium]|nr:MAG: cyclase family protein [Chloroflexota bacterium]